MSIIISQIKTDISEDKQNAVAKAIAKIHVSQNEVLSARIYKTSVDARKGSICFVHSVLVDLKNSAKELKLSQTIHNVRLHTEQELEVSFGSEKIDGDIFIAGFGPAGMFCALTLCELGYKPIVLERGAAMDERIKAVEGYWAGGLLDTSTNVQFGEGGAGTFSDGKLTTRISDPLCSRVLKKLHEFGAPDEILTKAKPHIGTDKLRTVVKNLRKRIIELGGEVRFLTALSEITLESGHITSLKANGCEEQCGALVLAVGHSAHDTFEMLLKKGVRIEPKPFSVGARIEHLQSDIDAALYGKYAGHPNLPPAEYQLSYRENGRGVYTFCMCPGGYVVASASSRGTIVTNGMSYFDRAGKNANSAVLVSVSPEDFGSEPLAGAEYIHRLEMAAYELGAAHGCGGKAPAMLTREFLGTGGALSFGRVTPTYSLGVESADLRALFPQQVTELMQKGLHEFDKRIKGFSDSDSVLTAAETRSSSPVRIPREESGYSQCADNLYPCGEGPGYAGGIMSAAVDGINIAIKIAERFAPNG